MAQTDPHRNPDAVDRKISGRLLPFLPELHLNEVVFGLITSVFFVGYVVFEVPSNLLLPKIGTPKTLTRIMILWSVAIVSMMFTRDQ
jgi:fucose permease